MAGGIFLAHTVLAGPFSITNRQYLNPIFQTQADAALNQLENDINKNMDLSIADDFLSAMANAGALTGKGMTVDYASNPELFSVGGAISVGIYSKGGLNNAAFNDAFATSTSNVSLPAIGAAITAAGNIGVSLQKFKLNKIGFFDPSKLSAYFSFFSVSQQIDKVNLGTTSVGLHAVYKVLDPWAPSFKFGKYVFNWGGLDVNTGFDYISQKLIFERTFQQATAGNSSGTGVFVAWDPKGTLGAKTGIFSIPFEVSTNVQILYILSLYTGLGLDINMGSSDSIVTLEGPLTGTNATLGQVFSGYAKLDLGESAIPTTLTLRPFFGLQVNISLLKVFAQMNLTTNSTYGFQAGLRVAY